MAKNQNVARNNNETVHTEVEVEVVDQPIVKNDETITEVVVQPEIPTESPAEVVSDQPTDDENQQNVIEQTTENLTESSDDENENEDEEQDTYLSNAQIITNLMNSNNDIKSRVIRAAAAAPYYMTRSQINKGFNDAGYKMIYQHVRNVLITPVKKS